MPPTVLDDPSRWLVVDVMNVVGSRPDGWWHDRSGAIRRLLGRLTGLAAARPGAVTAVVDRDPPDDPGGGAGVLQIVDAGRGRDAADDRIVALLAAAERPATVVTADRGLRARAAERGAATVGPTRLLRALDGLDGTVRQAAGAVTVLDGSVGHTLRDRVTFDERLWSTTALLQAPDTVRRLHVEYIRAGADVITTNTYGLTPLRLAQAGIGDDLEQLADLAGELAVQARAQLGRPVRIAGSLPPLRGSYRPDRVADPAELVPAYERLVGALRPHVDLLVCETLSTAGEGRTAAGVATASGLPTWVAWTLSDDVPGALRSGEPVAEATAALADLDVQALLVNCSTPGSASVALPRLVEATQLPVGVYPNALGDIPADVTPATTDRIDERADVTPAAFAAAAAGWVAAGARIVGGCCGIGPEHVRTLVRRLDGEG